MKSKQTKRLTCLKTQADNVGSKLKIYSESYEVFFYGIFKVPLQFSFLLLATTTLLTKWKSECIIYFLNKSMADLLSCLIITQRTLLSIHFSI